MLDTSLSFLEQCRQEQNSGVWTHFVEFYTPLLQSWLRRYKDLAHADTEDIVQEVLLTVSKELPQFEHNQQPGAFRRWLRLILVHRLRQFWDARRQQPRAIGGSDFQQQLQELEDDGSHISQMWDEEHDLHVMRGLIEQVRPRLATQTWEAFHRLVLLEEPPAEVAHGLGLSMGSIYMAKSRVLQALRKVAEGLV